MLSGKMTALVQRRNAVTLATVRPKSKAIDNWYLKVYLPVSRSLSLSGLYGLVLVLVWSVCL